MNNNLANIVINLLTNGNLQEMLNNPRFQPILNQAQQMGDLRGYVMQIAKQKGVDLQGAIDTLRQRGFNL